MITLLINGGGEIEQPERSVIANHAVCIQFTEQTSQRISGNHALLGHVDFGLRARLYLGP